MGCLQRSTMERCLAARAPGHFAATSQLRAASQQPPRAAAAAAAAGEMQPAFLAKKFGMSAVRWGAALGSVGGARAPPPRAQQPPRQRRGGDGRDDARACDGAAARTQQRHGITALRTLLTGSERDSCQIGVARKSAPLRAVWASAASCWAPMLAAKLLPLLAFSRAAAPPGFLDVLYM